jgi:RimJ/RimL family protein N-acetyltransferase
MTATRPGPAPLIGTFVRLDPLLKSDIPALFATIGHPEIFAGGYGGGPAGYRDTLEGFAEFAETYYSWDSANVYAVRLVGGEHDGLLVGTTTLGDFDLPNEYAHLGWTAYDPRVWGTAVNPEAKLLVLSAAFDSGIGRVKIQADALNDRSRAAILKLGAQFEGILRRDRPRADGTWRDSAVFSIITEEWPVVKNGLEARLAAFGGEPVAFRADSVGGSR